MAETGINLKSEPRVASGIGSIYLYHISLSAFPIPDADLARLKILLNKLTTTLVEKYRVKPEYFVQMNTVLKGEWLDLLTEYANFWRIMTGLGIRLDRRQGGLSKPVDLLLKPPDSPSKNTELIYYIRKDELFDRFFPGKKWPTGIEVYLGCGGVIVYLAPDGENFLDRAREFYLPLLSPADKNLEFYIPLIDMEDFDRVSEECLRVWFNLFDICIMETRQDPGIFIASRHDLDDLLMNLRGDIQWEEEDENNRRERLEDRAGG